MAGKIPAAIFFSPVPSSLAIQTASLRSKAMWRSPAAAKTVQANNKAGISRQVFIVVTLRLSSWQRQREQESGYKRDAKHNEINVSADEKFEGAKKPTLPINAADRQENLDCESHPEKSNSPSGEPTWSNASQAHRGAD